MSSACRCAAAVNSGSLPMPAHVWRSWLTPLYTAAPKPSARAGEPATVPRTVMAAVHTEETATIVRFVVMFASGDVLALLSVASNATTAAFAMFGIGPIGLSRTGRAPFVLDACKCVLPLATGYRGLDAVQGVGRRGRRTRVGVGGTGEMRVVVIGGGPAGVSAALHAAELGVEVTLIE